MALRMLDRWTASKWKTSCSETSADGPLPCSGGVADLLWIPLEKIPRSSIRVVPFFVVDRLYGLSGARPAEQQFEVLQRAWAEKHSLIFVGSTGGPAACGPDG